MGRKLSDLGEAWTNLQELAEDESIEKEQVLAALDEIKEELRDKSRKIMMLQRDFERKSEHYAKRAKNLNAYLLSVLLHRLGD
jgi:phage host-nuclease inhibitor protein Gam